MLEDDLDLEWFVRDNEEVDEKLPVMAKDVLRRGIDYYQLERENEEINEDIVAALVEVLDEHLDSFEQMTQEEITYTVQQLLVAALLVECVEEGMLEEVDGKYRNRTVAKKSRE